jgi:phosphoribosylformimino-5-aminoimidazole carboxamide ribotide isomerase
MSIENVEKKSEGINLSSSIEGKGFIIPAIDIIDGKCVRLTKGDYAKQKVYNKNPLEVAKQFEDAGIDRLHLVDLDGAKAGFVVNLKVLESIAGNTKLNIDFGGGIKKINDIESVFNAGASIVTIGSMAVKHPELLEEWLMEFGSDRFLIGADVLDEKIKIGGWLQDGGINVFDFIGKMIGLGVTNIFCTDIEKDGAMQGPSIELYKSIIAEHPEINLIASGGVTSLSNLEQLKSIGCKAAIVGKAIYEGSVPLNFPKGTLEEYIYFN